MKSGGAASKWRKAKTAITICNAFAEAADRGKARRLGVELRAAMKGGGSGGGALGAALLGEGNGAMAAAAVGTKDYFGEHALLHLCKNPSVTAEGLAQLFAAVLPGAADRLAKDRSPDGDLPLHALAANPGHTAAALKTFCRAVPHAAGARGKWGALPLHVCCANPLAGGASVAALIASHPLACGTSDGHRHKPVHYLCLRAPPRGAPPDHDFSGEFAAALEVTFVAVAAVRALVPGSPRGDAGTRDALVLARSQRRRRRLLRPSDSFPPRFFFFPQGTSEPRPGARGAGGG